MTPGNLVTLKISNGALWGERLPTRLKIFNWGATESVKGKFTVGKKSVSVLPENQKRLSLERVPLDFDHCTIAGTPANRQLMEMGVPPIIFGYGRPAVVEGDGTYLEEMTWTPLGEKFARNFEDLSPAIKDDDGEVVLVGSVALTPTGAIPDLHFFKAEVNLADATALSDGAGKKKCEHMNADDTFKGGFDGCVLHMTSCEGHSEESAKKICGKINAQKNLTTPMLKDQSLTLLAIATILGLPDTTAEADVLAEFKRRLTPGTPPDLTPLTVRVTTLEGKVPSGAVDLTPLTNRIGAVEQKVKDNETAATSAERDKLVLLFAADGKVPKKAEGSAYSADELRALDVATLKLLLANTTPTVPLHARGRVAQTDGTNKFRQTDKDGKIISIDMAGIFNSEAAARGQLTPPI